MPENSGFDKEENFARAEALHAAWIAGLMDGLDLPLWARFLNLPCPETYKVLGESYPLVYAYSQQAAGPANLSLREQWQKHHQLLEQTWNRLSTLSCTVYLEQDLAELLTYLRVAGMKRPFWQSRQSFLRRQILSSYSAYRCLYDKICIFSCDEHFTSYWNSLGLPGSEEDAMQALIRIACPDFLASSGGES